jgi:hypothetical protein
MLAARRWSFLDYVRKVVLKVGLLCISQARCRGLDRCWRPRDVQVADHHCQIRLPGRLRTAGLFPILVSRLRGLVLFPILMTSCLARRLVIGSRRLLLGLTRQLGMRITIEVDRLANRRRLLRPVPDGASGRRRSAQPPSEPCLCGRALWREGPASVTISFLKGLDRPAASSSQMGRFETGWLATEANLAALAHCRVPGSTGCTGAGRPTISSSTLTARRAPRSGSRKARPRMATSAAPATIRCSTSSAISSAACSGPATSTARKAGGVCSSP